MSAHYTPTRETLRAHRQIFWDAWQKAQADLPLNALEVRIARVIRMHPEYHPYFEDMEDFLERDFQIDDGMNPYLHLSLHLALEEQAASKQPPEMGQALIHMVSVKKMDRHDALHKILDILAEVIHQSQRLGEEPNHQLYTAQLKDLTRL
ncbi:MAG: DUF1841 family protein [Mariprofundaceae bacterium]|nr:DUF1841 family protein [Mariprofundaceae bacterium]